MKKYAEIALVTMAVIWGINRVDFLKKIVS